MAVSGKYHINYSASATPVEEVLGNNADSGTNSSRIVHSDIDKSVGGGKEIYCGTAHANVGYKDYTTTSNGATTLDGISGLELTDVDFLMVKIRESIPADGDCNCLIVIGSVSLSKLIKVGDVCLLRPEAPDGSTIKIYSNAADKTCKVDILWGLEA